MRAYKIVKMESDEFVSIVAYGKAKTVYKIDEKVVAPGWLTSTGRYPLLFSKLEFAVDFLATLSPYVNDRTVLVCDVENEVVIPNLCEITSIASGYTLQSFTPNPPKGTVSYEDVIPREVYRVADAVRTFIPERTRYILPTHHIDLNRIYYDTTDQFVEILPEYVHSIILNGNRVVSVYPGFDFVLTLENVR